MVQYILTPWRNRQELLAVRRQFYPPETGLSQPDPSASWAEEERSKRDGTTKGEKEEEHGGTIPGASPDLRKRRRRQRTSEDNDRERAVARVSMWMQRGNCPHLVESTALLTAAILSDGAASEDRGSSYAVRAAYSAAFSR
jgi:hypothetical protein